MASTRLQLALARRDRRQAMEALDGLIDIDAEIERFVAELSVPDSIHPDWTGLTDHLSEQKAAIASEKFSLASGITGPGLASAPNPSAEPNAMGHRAEAEPAPTRGQIILEPEPPAPRSYWKVLVALFTLVAIMLATAGYFIIARPDVDWLTAFGG